MHRFCVTCTVRLLSGCRVSVWGLEWLGDPQQQCTVPRPLVRNLSTAVPNLSGWYERQFPTFIVYEDSSWETCLREGGGLGWRWNTFYSIIGTTRKTSQFRGKWDELLEKKIEYKILSEHIFILIFWNKNCKKISKSMGKSYILTPPSGMSLSYCLHIPKNYTKNI